MVQHGEQFVLFAALDPATREVIHLSVAPSRNYLTTRRFLEELEELERSTTTSAGSDHRRDDGMRSDLRPTPYRS